MKKEVKKLLSVVIMQILLILCIFLFNAYALDNVYTYEITVDGCIITGYNGNGSSEIVVPDSIDGHIVTAIDERAFSDVKTLSKITLPETVKTIKDEAFYNCSNLSGFVMPESVTNIGEAVFSGCRNLKEVVFSKNIKIIPDSTFYNCVSLSNIKLSEDVYIISDKAFFSCSSLKRIVLPESIRVIGRGSFLECSSLVSVYFPSTVESIGADAFGRCTQLEDVYFQGSSQLNESFSISSGNDDLIKAEWSYKHKHSASSFIVKVDATCESDGYTESDCICGFSNIDNKVPALGHNVSVLHTVKEPGCTYKGLARIYCSRCDYFEEMIIPETAHKTVIDAEVSASCLESGKTQGSHCYVCKTVIIPQKTVAALGHDFSTKIIDEAHLVSPATYSAAALYRYSCSRCDAISQNSYFADKKLYLGKPSKSAFASNESAIKLAWSAVPDADFYGLFFKDYNGIWKFYKKYYSTSCQINYLPAGATYTFGVKAYVEEKGNTIASPYYIEFKAATQAPRPSQVASVQNEKAIKLAWTASKGATGYRVYGYDAYKKSWIVVVSSTTDCSVIISGLKSGVSYGFAVRPYIITDSKVVWSSNYTTIITATKPAYPSLKATSLKGGVRFNWDKVSGADGYAVYGSTRPNSGYIRLSLTTGTTYSISGLASGQTYYFKAVSVKIVNGKYLLSAASPTKPVKTR